MPLPDAMDDDYEPPQTVDEAYRRVDALWEMFTIELCNLGLLAKNEPEAIGESKIIAWCHEMAPEMSDRGAYGDWDAQQAAIQALCDRLSRP